MTKVIVFVEPGQSHCYECGVQFVNPGNRINEWDYIRLECPNGHNRGTVASAVEEIVRSVPLEIEVM